MTVNMIAMAALSGGYGRYSKQEIEYHLSTAFTSFVAAKIESAKDVQDRGEDGSDSKVIIHTGNWGTGIH